MSTPTRTPKRGVWSVLVGAVVALVALLAGIGAGTPAYAHSGGKAGVLVRELAFTPATSGTGYDARLRLADAFEEVAHAHAQGAGNVEQLGGGDAVEAALIFLHLLEGEPERIGQPLLAQSQLTSARADAGADVHVDGVGRQLLVHAVLTNASSRRLG